MYLQGAALSLLATALITSDIFEQNVIHGSPKALWLLPPLLGALWVYLGYGRKDSLRYEAFLFLRGVGATCLCVLLVGGFFH